MGVMGAGILLSLSHFVNIETEFCLLLPKLGLIIGGLNYAARVPSSFLVYFIHFTGPLKNNILFPYKPINYKAFLLTSFHCVAC